MKSGNKLLHRLAFPYVVWISIFIVLPILLIAWYSITPTSTAGSFTYMVQFTLQHFTRFFTTQEYLVLFYSSFRLALVTTLLTFILGYPIAILLANMSGKARNILLLLIVIPMWTNMLLRIYAWRFIIDEVGIVNTFIRYLNSWLPFNIPTLNILYTDQAVILGMIYSFLPFMILPIYAVIVKLDKDYLNAAYDLGANKFKAFMKITFPLSLPGIMSGITMVFLPAATTFIIPTYLGSQRLIGNVIEEQFKGTGNNPNFGSALSILLMIVIFGITGVMNYFSSDEEKGESLW